MRRDCPKKLEKYYNCFCENGLRFTTPRKVILEVLQELTGHRTVEEIYFEVHKAYPQIGLTTIYRNLELLYSWGFVDRFEFGEGKSRYELRSNDEEDHHHHLVCENCKKIVDYSDFVKEEVQLMEKIKQELQTKYDFRITNHKVEFRGLCPECKSAGQNQ